MTQRRWSSRMWGWVVALALVGWVHGPGALAAVDEARAAARSLAEQGAAAFAEQRFGDAVDLFERAEGLVHSPVHLLFVARASVQLGRLVKAQEAYIKITREELAPDAPEVFVNTANEAATELEALKPRIPVLTIRVTGADPAQAQVTLDGVAVPSVLLGVPMPVDPGQRKLEATAEGMLPATQELAVGEGHKGEVELALVPTVAATPAAAVAPATDPQAPPSDSGSKDTLRYAAYGGFGLGVAGIAVGAVFLSSASDKNEQGDALFEACDPGCSRSEIERIDQVGADEASAKTLSLVGFAVGGAGIAAGVTLLLLSFDDEPAEARAPRLAPWVGWNAAGLQGTF